MENLGKVEIAPEVIETIASLATAHVSGVYSMSGGVVDDITQLLGRKNLRQGVRVNFEENNTSIHISVIVEYGVSIPEVGRKVQDQVKESVENMTGIHVDDVIISVEGIKLVSEVQEEEVHGK